MNRILVVACSLLVAVSGVTGTIQVTSACNGTGFAGTYTEGSTMVHFEACPVSGGARAKFWKPDGSLIIEFLDENGTLTNWIGGIPFTENITAEQEQQMAAALDSPEALIGHKVGRALVGLSMDPTSPQFVALAAASLLFERGDYPSQQYPSEEGKHPCTDPRNDCLGCCGKGCDGCYGVCTEQCRAHDECVTEYGYTAKECSLALQLADASLKECYNYLCNTVHWIGCQCCCAGSCDCYDY